MDKTITATEAVRKFSEILNSVKYRGDRYTILRGGSPVASLFPVEISTEEKVLGELKRLLKSLPKLGEEAEKFAQDLKEIRKYQPSLAKDGQWA